MFRRKSNEEHIHAAGLLEIGILPKFRDTPTENRAVRQALGVLTQVKSSSITRIPATGEYCLFAELDFGHMSPTALKQEAPYVIHRVLQKAINALQHVQISTVK